MAGSQREIHPRCSRIGGFPTLILRKTQEVEALAFNPGAKRSLKGTGGTPVGINSNDLAGGIAGDVSGILFEASGYPLGDGLEGWASGRRVWIV